MADRVGQLCEWAWRHSNAIGVAAVLWCAAFLIFDIVTKVYWGILVFAVLGVFNAVLWYMIWRTSR